MSNDISPKIWGDPAWKTIKNFVVNYEPSIERPANKCIEWIQLLVHVLPCSKCRIHWSSILKKYPLSNYMQSRDTRQEWFNLVRKEVFKHENGRGNWTIAKITIPVVVVVTLSIITILFFVLRKQRKR